ncbi:regulator of G protein signaling-like domain protein [Cooperia oncophora]
MRSFLPAVWAVHATPAEKLTGPKTCFLQKFFYMITDAFQNAQGAPKDFRRWAFEIFTTFVIPNSPLVIPNSDQSIIQPIDKILATTSEQICESDVEILKRVFVPGRQRAVTDINEHMANFRQKRQLGKVD